VIRSSKLADERRECGPAEIWCLHGAVGSAADWRTIASQLAARHIGSRAVDLWRFLDCAPMSLTAFGEALNAEARGEVFRGSSRVLMGYSMGGRLALHALLNQPHPWQAAVIISAHPGLEAAPDRAARLSADAAWAAKALTGNWAAFLDDWSAQPVLAGGDIRDAAAQQRLALRRREIARGFVDWSLGAQQPLWNRLPEIQIPILWIVGEHDEKFRSLGARAVGLLPSAKLAIAPQAGHRVPWQAGDWLAGEVAAFLQTGVA
jgi:2-succinyl-6-hydroxy-2,4-cyclohexadiene-1-carboxylate synthase